jgi:Spy/CpxP family protein refolding chaperone
MKKGHIIDHALRNRFGHRFLQGTALAVSALLLSGLAGCGRFHRHPSELSAEELVSRVDRGATWMLWKVDASDEQQAQVKSVLKKLTPDVAEFQARHKALKAQFAKTLASDQINQDELAKLRAAGLDLTEQAFSRSFDTMILAATVLTPEQRRKLAEAWEDRP